MINDAVVFMSFLIRVLVSFFEHIYSVLNAWPLLFAGISMILISRFLLGPIVGFTGSGASDIVRKSKSSKGDDNG